MITEKFNDLFDFAKKSKIKAGDGLKEGLYPFYTSSATLSKRIDVFQEERISLIFGTGGKASIHYVNEQFSTSTDCIVALKKEAKVFNEKFVYYYLFGNIHILERGFKGAGLKHISKKYIQNLDIPILPIETQNKIVTLLDKASALVQKREESITQLDELLRAQFLEMFGDIASDKKKPNTKPLEEYIKIKHGYAFKSKYFREDGELVLLTPGNFYEEGGYKDRKDKQKYYKGEFPLDYLLNKNDLLLAMTEQAPGLLGSPVLVPDDNKFLHNQRLGLIQQKNKLTNKFFLFCFFNTKIFRDLVHNRGTGLKVRHTSPTKIEAIEVNIPSIELQNQFETIYHHIQEQKETLTQSKSELEHLYNSLLQESFKGEIEVSKKEVKKKDSLMSEIKKKEGEKVDITNLDLATYLGIPDEITSTREKWMFDLISLDEFYQFLLKDNFTKEEAFTLQDIEEKLHHFFYHGGDMDFSNASWQQIIFKFLEAKPPLLEQIFEEETATVKLKLTDETFKA